MLDTDDQVDRALEGLVRRGIGKTKSDVVKKALLTTLGGTTTMDKDKGKKADWKQAIDSSNGESDMVMVMMMMMQMQQQRDAMLQRLAATPSSDKDSKAEILEYIKMADERAEKQRAAWAQKTHHDDLMAQFQARTEQMMSQHAGDMEHLDERLRRILDRPSEDAGAGELEIQKVKSKGLLRLEREQRVTTVLTQCLGSVLEEVRALRQTADYSFRSLLSMMMQYPQQPPLQNARTEQERAVAYAQIQAQLQQRQLEQAQAPVAPTQPEPEPVPAPEVRRRGRPPRHHAEG